MTTRHPSGFSVVLGVIIALVVVAGAVVGIFAYGSRSQPAASPVNQTTSVSDSVVKLDCSQDTECAAYCGLDSCYTALCDATKHCSCNYTCEPVPAGDTNTSTDITTFAQCAAAGNPVQESYPRKCTAGGVTFTEVLTNSNGNVNSAANTNQSTNANVSTAGWKTYTNTELGFSLKFPSTWDGYTTGQVVNNTIKFTHPKKESTKGNPGEVSFIVVRLTKGLVIPTGSTLIKENESYKFVYSRSNAAAPDEMNDLWEQIDDIISTFTFTE